MDYKSASGSQLPTPNTGLFRTSQAQWERMLEFMEQHGDLAAAQFGPSQSREQVRQLWEELTVLLNSQINGCSKDYRKWAKAWADWKHKVKLKAAKIEAAKARGENYGQPLTPLEERLVLFMNWEFDTSAADWNYPQEVAQEERVVTTEMSDADPDPLDHSDYEMENNSAPPERKVTKRSAGSSEKSMQLFADIERDRVTLKRKCVMRMNRQVALEERRVALEDKRLALEERRYALEERRLPLEESRLAAEKSTSEAIIRTLELCKEAFSLYLES